MEYNEPQEKSFKDRVLKSIATDDVKVYSRTHFVLRMILLIVLVILVMLVSVFLFNYIFFNVRISGRGSLLDFGPAGIVPFLQSFPWILLIVDIVLVGVLQWMFRKFRFGYRIPVLYLLLALLVVTAAFGYAVDRGTGFNEALLHQADQNHLPAPFGNLYENARRPPPGQGLCECEISAINGNDLTAFDVNADTLTSLNIIMPPDYPGLNSFKVGDVIFLAGTRTASDTIQAFGASLFPPGGMGGNHFNNPPQGQ